MVNCIICNSVFDSKRQDAKYCSAKCRVKANRNRTDVLNVTDVTDNTEQHVTDNIEPPKELPLLLHDRYRREAEYRVVIDRLLINTIDQLRQSRIFIPVWRYNLDQ